MWFSKNPDPNALMQQGKYDEAAKLLEAKLDKSPSDLSLQLRLAEAYESAGRASEAKGVYLAGADAALADGIRGEGLALLKKALRVAPEDQALMARIAEHEDNAPITVEQAFSFDVNGASGCEKKDVASAPPSGPPEPPISEPAGRKQEKERAPGSSNKQVLAGTLLARVFPDIEDAHRAMLMEMARVRELGPGEVLIREEEQGDSLFIVVEGGLEARGHIDGKELWLAELGPGDILGEVAFLKRVPRTATVTARAAAVVLELPVEATRAQMQEHPEVQMLLDEVLSQRVQRTINLIKQKSKATHDHSQD